MSKSEIEQIPILKLFNVNDEKEASSAADEMVKLGFLTEKKGFKVIMPKESRLAKRIGYIVTTTVTAELGKAGQDRNIKYWTYHHDDEHYAIVLVNAQVLEELGFGF
jgi:hypothetical protein